MGRVKKGNRAQRKDLRAMAGGMEALAMKDFIKECRIPDMEEGDKLGDSPLTQEEDDEERRHAHTIVGRSPFTYEFRKVMEEVIECYIRGILNLKDNAGRLYLLDHYTVGVILHGTREQMARQELQKVTFDLYDGAIGFVNIRNVHWKFVYLHALSNHMYVVDPLQGSNEVEDSRKAGYKCGEYFKMRRNRLGKEDWVNIKWQPGKITHTFQKDATSCGVFVMQMAKMTTFHIKSSKQCLQHIRRDTAEEILKGSVSKDDFCSFCGIEDLPTTAVDAVWIQCETCGRWFHTQCLGMTAARIPTKKTPWYCVLCILPN
ncbi:hypothetical protein JOQ06_022456 [Pogonophryne albipinna]|uniref:PHD-type domain-containing protein n=1 Tax=Pogonophryne albipinna TaxID=1090488 RepID=A0AAD6A7Y6_9TELE|nr:hypothetical protein JOQ06_022456 [Pogonophryne albipinna]